MSPVVIPAPVPVPLPVPVWLLELLSVFTFILHLVPMSLVLGGTLLLAISSLRGRTSPRHREFARHASGALPPAVAFAITLGVAPLLFLQLVYGQLFYTSSVLMAWFWLAVVFLVLLGYYGVYWFNLQQAELGPRAPRVMLLTAVIFLLVSFTFTQNMTRMLRPEEFYSDFLSGGVGSMLAHVTASNVARWLHMLVGAVAIAGLGTAILSRKWRQGAPELAGWARRYGVGWFMAATALQFLVGILFLISLPFRVTRLFMGGDALSTSLLVVAILLAVVAFALAPRSLLASGIAIFGTISLMAVIRHLVRTAFLEPYFDPRSLPVRGQWGVFAIFALLLVAGLATVGWMLYVFFRPPPRAA